jgi:hypothetical protein
MANTVYFNGDVLTIPGAYSAIDVSNLQVKSDGDGAKTIAIIGECTGGEPQVVQFFSEPTVARKILKSGELLKACEKAWNPVSGSKEGVPIGGANIIAVIRSNAATKSFLEIDPEGVVAPTEKQIVFQSKDWGKDTAHQVKISNGTIEGTKNLTIYDQTNDVYEHWDNVGRMFSIGYTGDKAYAEVNVYKDSNGAMYLQTKIGDDEASAVEDIHIALDPIKYKNLRVLISDLQSYENYKVIAATRYNMRLKVNELDIITKKNIKSTQLVPTATITATFADTASTLALNSRLIEVKSYNKEIGNKTIPNTNGAYLFLTGGSEGSSPASWIKFFDMLSNYDIQYIVPLIGDISIHAELMEHVMAMSGTMGKERRGVVGGNVNETINESIQRARDLNHARMQVVHGGFYDVNSNNELELYPPYILAAQHAGRAAFLPDGEPATHDIYRMSAPEYQLEANEITALLQSGVLAFEFVIGQAGVSQSHARLVQDLTTDLVNQDVVHVERATGQLADSINKEIRRGLDSLLTGKRTSLTDLTSAKNRVISILQERQRNGYIIAYKDVYVSKTGTITTVDYGVAAAEPNNFTLITAHYYSETLTAE